MAVCILEPLFLKLALRLQVGEAMAELVSRRVMTSAEVLGILSGAAGSKPDASNTERCMACLQAFCLRFQDLTEAELEADVLQAIRKLLPKLLCKVRTLWLLVRKICLKDDVDTVIGLSHAQVEQPSEMWLHSLPDAPGTLKVILSLPLALGTDGLDVYLA